MPRYVEFRESLPQSAVGKVLRRALVEGDRTGQERSAGQADRVETNPEEAKEAAGQPVKAVF